MKIYLATSWRNPEQPDLVAFLREIGHEVYDFKNPGPGERGFGWRQVDPDFHADELKPDRFRRMLEHPIAQHGFRNDFRAMQWADACVLALPCGLSAHMEFGWMAGAMKRCVVYMPALREPELMYLLGGISPFASANTTATPPIVTTRDELAYWAGRRG